MVHSMAYKVLCKSTFHIIIQSIRQKLNVYMFMFCSSFQKKRKRVYTKSLNLITIEIHDSIPITKNLTVIFIRWSMHRNLNEFTCPKFTHIHASIYLICDCAGTVYISPFHSSCLTSRKTDHRITTRQVSHDNNNFLFSFNEQKHYDLE